MSNSQNKPKKQGKPVNTKKIKLMILRLIPAVITGYIIFVIAGFLPINFPVPHWVVGIIGGIGMKILVHFHSKNAKKWRQDEEYGSARWGTSDDIQPFIDPNPANNIILTQTESLTMNSRPRPAKNARNKNVLVIGGSGSGKTRFFVKPNLMQCESEDYPVSFIVTDPKGTVLLEMGKFLKEKAKYEIKILNTIDFAESHGYNPFSYINAEKDILKLVNGLLLATKRDGKGGGDQFWEDAERLLYSALIGYIWYVLPKEDQNFNTLVEMVNLMEVREDNETFKNPVDFMFEELESQKGNENHFAVRMYKKYKLAAGKTAKSILISCGARLAPFDIQEVRDMMSYDQLELDKLGGYIREEQVKDLKTGKYRTRKIKEKPRTALFVIISDTDSTFNFIISLLYIQLFDMLCDKAIKDFSGQLPVHCRFILDEFANIAKIPDFEKKISTFRSREISAAVILQAQSQLKSIYKDDMDTIIGNMDTKLFLGGCEKSTLKDMEEVLGKQTVHMYNTSVTKGQSESHGQNYGGGCTPIFGRVEPYYINYYVAVDIVTITVTNPRTISQVKHDRLEALEPDYDEENEYLEHFLALVYTRGLRQFVGSPFTENWGEFMVSPYGYRFHPVYGERRFHSGIDIAMPTGTPLLAGLDGGTVVTAAYLGGYGNTVIIEFTCEDTGVSARVLYAHMNTIDVSAGDVLPMGYVIGTVGQTGTATGPHLHMEVFIMHYYETVWRRLNPIFFVDVQVF